MRGILMYRLAFHVEHTDLIAGFATHHDVFVVRSEAELRATTIGVNALDVDRVG